MMINLDTLFKSEISAAHREINEDFRMQLIFNGLEGFVRGLVAARILMCIGVLYFAGWQACIATFLGFEILRQASDNIVTSVKEDLKKKLISNQEAEVRLIFHPVARSISIAIVFLFLIQLSDDHAQDAAFLILFGNMAYQIYQNSNSLKLVLASALSNLAIVIAKAGYDAFIHNSYGPLVAPVLFFIGMITLALLTYRDRIRALGVRFEMEEKTNRLEKMFQDQLREHLTRENVERLARVGTFQWYFDGRKTYWSPGAYSAFGFEENQPVPNNKEFLACIAPEFQAAYRKVIAKAREEGKSYEFGFDLLHGENKRKNVFTHGAPIFDDTGNAIGVEGIVVDQTHVAEALNSVSSAQELLQMALVNGRSAVLERDLSTGAMRGYGALDIFDFAEGDDPAELDDKVLRCLGRRDTHIVFGAMGRAETSGQLQLAEHRIVHADGKEIHVRVAMGVEGKMTNGKGRLVTITTDITDEVNHRQQLADALEVSKRASRVKSEFLANMSHEIRTPLNGVIAVAGILAKTNLDANQREMVKLVETSGEALSHIINDVLDLARVESGRLEVEHIEFNLKDALNSVTALFGVKADEKGLYFNVNIDDAANGIFLGDPIRIRQIIGNLVSNAIKFTQIGSVTLTAQLDETEDNCDDFSCTFTIKDTGDGMSPETLSRLFERFEQADGSITRKHGGSGLGLSISRALAQLMGGQIDVTSAVGVGSAFTFSIPLHRVAEVSAETNKRTDFIEVEEIDEAEDEMGTISILAADDNATNRRVFDMVLRPMGVDLTLCENGLEALETFKIRHFDIVLMDLQMPVMDGLTATRKIREYEAEKGTHTPIIAVSANAMSHHIDEAMEAGVDMHISKPFTPQSLIDGIEKGLSLNDNQCEDEAFVNSL